MFDSIIYRNAISSGPLIDIGSLAEGLLFYGRVAIVGNRGTIGDLLTRVPPFILLELLRSGRIEFHYLGENTGVMATPAEDSRSMFSLIRFSLPDDTIEEVGGKPFKVAAGNTAQAKLGASQFVQQLRPLNYSGFDQMSVLESLTDSVSTDASVEALIRIAAPGYQQADRLRFRIEPQNTGFYVDTNIDFQRLNEIYSKVVPVAHSTMTEAHIVSLIQSAYEATFFASKFSSDIAISPIERVVQEVAVQALVSRCTRSESQIAKFVDLVLTDAHAIREAINSGEVPFASVIKLLDAADRFRHWLRDQPMDVDLLRAYYRETIKDSWAEKMPTKSVRWGLFTGMGLAADAIGAGGLGTAAGVAISAVDAFVVDKLLRGWKPHQFVEGDLRSLFIRKT